MRKSSRKSSIDNQLHYSQLALTNIQSTPKIFQAMVDYGYDADALSSGQQLYEHAALMVHRRRAAHGQQQEATAELKRRLGLAQASYIRLLKLARIALKGDRSAAVSLQLDGPRQRPARAWVEQARQFYTNALRQPEIMAQLDQLRIGPAQLAAGLALAQDVEDALHAQGIAMGAARAATAARNAALDALAAWLGDCLNVARIALADDAQRLESLGIVVPS